MEWDQIRNGAPWPWRRIRVHFLIRSLAIGGSQRRLATLVKGLDKRFFEPVIIVFYPDGGLSAEVQEAGVPIVSLEKKGRWNNLPFLLRWIIHLRRSSPDVLFGFLGVANLLVAAGRLFAPSAKVIFGIASADPSADQQDWIGKIILHLESFASRFADLIVTNSESSKKYLQANRFPDNKLIVIQNGIDVHRFQYSESGRQQRRKAWGITDDQFLIGTACRLDPVKDLATFLRAAAQYQQEDATARFVIVGSGNEVYQRELKREASELGIEPLLLWIPAQTEMTSIYSALDLFTSSSTVEGLPNAVAEAMSCGVPCVATAAGDTALLIGDAGLIVPPRRPDELVRAWAAVRQGAHQAFGQDARSRIVTAFSVERYCASVTEAFCGLFADRQ